LPLRDAFALRLINDGVLATTEGEGRIVLSYALREDYWCKGLAPEACRAALRYGFEQLGLEEIGTSTRAETRPGGA
jgi:RimJ/RimL family protein N-acetyltransferase